MVYCYTALTAQKKKIYNKKLVLGCGTLITTKLIMEYLNIKNEIRINHHPRLFSLIFRENGKAI